MVRQISGFDIKVFVENKRRDQGDYQSRTSTRARVARGWLHDYGKGQVAYSGPVLKLARLVNEKAGEHYAQAFGAEDGQFPALIDADTLHKCGYFDSHPNAVTFVGNIIEDFDAIEEFRRANSCSEGALLPRARAYPHRRHVPQSGGVLPLLSDAHGPHHRRRRVLSPGWAACSATSCRNINGLDRLYEFNVRELVFVGDRGLRRAACRQKRCRSSRNWPRYFDLDCRVQTATDPFFATVSAAKKFWQAAQEVKNEIKIPVLDGDGQAKLLACGSINLHGNFFGRRFDIKDADGAPGRRPAASASASNAGCSPPSRSTASTERRWPEAVRRHHLRLIPPINANRHLPRIPETSTMKLNQIVANILEIDPATLNEQSNAQNTPQLGFAAPHRSDLRRRKRLSTCASRCRRSPA